MQNLESRQKAYEQQISTLEHLFKEITRTMRDKSGASLLTVAQNNIHGPTQSVEELEVGTALRLED
jgi:hypothetical protein